MNRAVKWTLIAAGALAALAVAGLILAAALIDPNAYKPEIVRLVKDKTGRELKFAGDLKLSVFPVIGVDVGGVELGNARGFGDKPFARLGRTSVRLKLLPLVFGQVRLGRVSVDGLNLNLAVNEQGVSNWQDLAGKEEPKKEEKKPDRPAGGPDLSVGGLAVADANIDYDNRQTRKRYSLRNARITLGALSPGSPFDFELAFGVELSDPQLAAQNTLSGTASLDLAARRYEITGLKAAVAASGKAVPGGKADLALGAARLKADLERQTLAIEGLSLTALGVTATGSAEGANILDAPQIAASLSLGPCSLRQALAALAGKPLDTADPKALDAVSGKLEMRYGPDLVEARNVALKLDETTITASLRRAGTERPAYAVAAALDAIDLDRYLAPRKEGEAPPPAGSAPAGGAGEPEKDVIPVAALRELRLAAEFTAGSLIINKIRTRDVQVTLRAADGIVDLNPARLALYGGAVRSTARLDLAGEQPRTALNLRIESVQAGPLVKDMTGKENFAGLVNADSALTCQGAKASAMKRTLNGTVSFSLKDGVFPGVNLDALALAAARSKDKPGTLAGNKEDQTRFGEVTGTARIVDGVVLNKDLDVKAPHIRASGEGLANLNTETIDYLLKARVVASGEGQGGGGGLGEVIGITVPVRVTGTFKDPSYGVSLAEYAKMLGQAAVDAVGGVVQGVGSVLKGVAPGQKQAGGPQQPAQPAPKKEKKKGGLL